MGMATRSWVGIGLVFIMLLPLASADLVSRVELTDAGSLAEDDLGIKVGAVSPSGEDILIAGMNGYAHLLSAKEADNRDMDIELVTGKNATIHDIAWHPRGNTALLVGEEGLAMRYDSYDHSVTNVNGSFSVLGKSLTTVIWRPGGDFAYVGAADGSVWKFAEHTGFERLENLGTSEVNDIACHRNYNVCFLATMDEGIAVIDEGHAVSWVGQTAAETWVGIDCADPALNECVGFASGLQSKVIRINTIDASKSSAQSAMRFDLPSGEQTAVTRGHDGTTLVHLAPLGLLRHTPLSGEAFSVLIPEDAASWDAVVAGRSLSVVWETGLHTGFMITEFGNIISFSPAVEEVEMNIMDVLVLGAVAISVPGVILGLIYMNSPWLQRKYKQLRFGKK